MGSIFLEIGIILIATTILVLLFRFLKQPPMLAYIVSGLIMGPLVFNIIKNQEILSSFSQIGIAFLLFIVGLSLNINILREVGKVSVIAGIGQVLFTGLLGWYVGTWIGFSALESMYLGVALAFSSTIIVIKLLSDSNDLETLHGKIAVGFLLVQDAIAVFLLILLSSFNADGLGINIGITIIKGIIVCGIAFLASKLFVTNLFEKVARAPDTLFITAISWCFALATISYGLGFTLEMGAFLAGVSLASLPYSVEISNKIKPLRDFFIILFFVGIGSSVVLPNLQEQLITIIVLSLFVLVGKPLIVVIIMSILGFKSRTGVLSGVAIAQISEFSLILVAVGMQLGHVSAAVVSIVSAVGIVTIAASTYMITYNEKLFAFFSKYVKWMERKDIFEKKLSLHHESKQYDVILLGQHRIGYSILKNLIQKKERLLVVDYNPTIVKDLIAKKIPCIYGDVADPDILGELRKYKPKIVISTIHLFEDNLLVTKIFRKLGRNITLIVTASTIKKALELYADGADYVIIPHILGGEKVSSMLRSTIADKRKLKILKSKHIKELLNAEIPQQ